MDKLYSWTAKRAGSAMTVEHSCGKIAGVEFIAPNSEGVIIATHTDGRQFELCVGSRNW